MRPWRTFPMLLALLLGASAGSLDAQIGPIIDWITGLSGPGVGRAGLQFTTPLQGRDGALELSVAGMYGADVKDGSGRDGDTDLNLLSFRGTLDARLFRITPTIDVLAIGGIAGHSFTGTEFNSFGAVSFPLNLALRFGLGSGPRLPGCVDHRFLDTSLSQDSSRRREAGEGALVFLAAPDTRGSSFYRITQMETLPVKEPPCWPHDRVDS